MNTLLEVLHVLQLRELRRDQPQHDRLVARQEPQRLERARARRVILQIIAVHPDLREELDRDAVVPALAEVHPILEVAPAQVQADGHVRGAAREQPVVRADVEVEERGVVDAARVHAREHRLRAEVREQRVVELHVPAPRGVQRRDLLLVREHDVVEVLLCERTNERA